MYLKLRLLPGGCNSSHSLPGFFISMASELTLQAQFDKPETSDKFKKFYLAMNKGVDETTAAQQYELEKFNFLNEIHTKGYNDCTQISIMGVFLDVMSAGLTFNKQAQHVYMMTRNVEVKQPNGQKSIWEKRLVFQIQADGKEFLAIKAGSISRTTKPIIVYRGDKWGKRTNEKGEMIPVYEYNENHTDEIIAGFIGLKYPDGSNDFYFMEKEDIDRLKAYSKKQNERNKDVEKRVPNPLYSSNNGQIDIGFFKTKLMTHALNHIGKAPIAKANEVNEDFVEEQNKFTPTDTNVIVAEHDPEVNATVIESATPLNNESDDLAF